MALKKQSDRISEDEKFAKHIFEESKERKINDKINPEKYSLYKKNDRGEFVLYSEYCIDKENYSNGMEKIDNTKFIIYNIGRKNKHKDEDFLISRAKHYFNGSRVPEDYEFFIRKNYMSDVKLSDNVDPEAKVAYYKKYVKKFAERCYNHLREYDATLDPTRDDFFRYVKNKKIKEETKVKKAICLHYTAGASVRGDCHTLFEKFREAVHYVVGRDGSIYRLFEDKYYSGHLGSFEDVKNKDGESINDNLKRFNDEISGEELNLHNHSISIEISNLGYDVRKSDYDQEEKEEKFRLNRMYRGYEYYEKLTENQKDAVCALIYYLIKNSKEGSLLCIPNVWRVDFYNESVSLRKNCATEYAAIQMDYKYKRKVKEIEDNKKIKDKDKKKKELEKDIEENIDKYVEEYRQEFYDYGSKFSSLSEANKFAGVFTHTDYRFGKEDFPTEIIQKIRERYQELYPSEDKGDVDELDDKYLSAYVLFRCKQLQEKGYSTEEIVQIVYKQMIERVCLPEEELLYSDPNVDHSPSI